VVADVPRSADARSWLGVDPAGSGDDRSAYVSVDEHGHVHVEATVATETTPEALGRIKALDRRHGYTEILVDKNGLGTGLFDFANEDLPHVRPMNFSPSEQEEMWPTLKRSLEAGSLTLPDHDRLTHELQALEYSWTRGGKLRVDHPPGGHDDHCDGLALAVYGWQRAENRGPRRRTRQGASPRQRSRVRSR
jgi:phage FluMu gp28-like protein